MYWVYTDRFRMVPPVPPAGDSSDKFFAPDGHPDDFVQDFCALAVISGNQRYLQKMLRRKTPKFRTQSRAV